MLHSVRRAAALVAAPALATLALVAAPSPASAAAADPAPAAAADLARPPADRRDRDDLVRLRRRASSYDDYGLTIDAALALASAGGHDAMVDGDRRRGRCNGRRVHGAGLRHAGAAGATAKALCSPRSPAATRSLRRRTCQARSRTRRHRAPRAAGPDASTPASRSRDYANVLGQAFAATALDAGRAAPWPTR